MRHALHSIRKGRKRSKDPTRIHIPTPEEVEKYGKLLVDIQEEIRKGTDPSKYSAFLGASFRAYENGSPERAAHFLCHFWEEFSTLEGVLQRSDWRSLLMDLRTMATEDQWPG